MFLEKALVYVEPNLKLKDSVIIVGSSGNLCNTNMGEEIDSYSEIIRFNRAPTETFEESVGSKTTLRITNNHVFDNINIKSHGYTNQPHNFIKNLRNNKILYIGPDIGPWNRKHKNSHSSNELFLFRYDTVNEIKKRLLIDFSGQLTVGAITIALCVLSDIRPVLVGFDLAPGKRTHYWEQRPPKASKVHNTTAEQTWLKHLEKENKIYILR